MKDRYPREVRMEVNGEQRRILVCLWGLKLAEEKGYDISQLEVEGENAGASQMLDLIWIGMLPFEEDLTRKEVGMTFSLGDMAKAESAFQKIKSRQLTSDVKEEVSKAANSSGK